MAANVPIMSMDWNGQLVDQLDWHWQNHVRKRLEGLSDDEYFWEPVTGCWSVRRRPGSDEYVMEYEWPEPQPVPFTTIAWRLAHINVDIFGRRTANHFGGPAGHRYAGTASEALQQLDDAYAAWVKGARDLGEEGLARPCGPAEGPYSEYPMSALLLHIHREAIHHAAEVLLLRDLYRNRGEHGGL